MAFSPYLSARLARPVQALALGLCACSAALVLLSGYALLRPDPTRDPAAALPNFMRSLTRVVPAAGPQAPHNAAALTVQLRGCGCSEPATAASVQVREPRRPSRVKDLQV